MEELNPCPFCGGKAKLYQSEAMIGNARFADGFGGYETMKALSYEWLVHCTVCHSQGISAEDRIVRDESGEITILVDGRSSAIKAWNRRAAK